MSGVSLYLLTRVVAMAYLIFPGGNGLKRLGYMPSHLRDSALRVSMNRLCFGVWSEVTP